MRMPAMMTSQDMKPGPWHSHSWAEVCRRFIRDSTPRSSGQSPHHHRTGSPVRYGRWVTIGAREGPDGERHGGSPVYIEDGRITRGHPSLAGRRIDALNEVAETTP